VPGINDHESHLYREYDSKGRINHSFANRAALSGVKNLETSVILGFKFDVKETMDLF
jgi:hypothetical protein